MWAKQLFLAGVGLSAGFIVAGGIFSFIISLGIVSDFADRTHTGRHVLLYEDTIALGGILGTIFFIFRIHLPFGRIILPVFGLFGGIFVGCWAMALAEMLNVFPIFVRRIKLIKCIPYIILSVALGKGLGTFLYYYMRW